VIGGVLLEGKKKALRTQMNRSRSRIINGLWAIVGDDDLRDDIPDNVKRWVKITDEEGKEVAISKVATTQETEEQIVTPGGKVGRNSISIQLPWNRGGCRVLQKERMTTNDS
jgi:hypothetical protein